MCSRGGNRIILRCRRRPLGWHFLAAGAKPDALRLNDQHINRLGASRALVGRCEIEKHQIARLRRSILRPEISDFGDMQERVRQAAPTKAGAPHHAAAHTADN